MKRQISEEILLGGWPPGSPLAGEVELAERFGVAVGTVRRALSDLVAEGMLTRRPRVGTVVTGRAPEHSLRFFFRYFRLHGADGSLQRSRAQYLSIEEVPARGGDVRRLMLPAGAPLLFIRRLRLIEDRPVLSDLVRIPTIRVPGFPYSGEHAPELLYLYLLEEHGIRVTAVREELSAELATPRDYRELELPQPSAVLVIEATAFDQSGSPCMLMTSRARTDAHRYVNEVR